MSGAFTDIPIADLQVECAACRTPLVVPDVPTKGLSVGEVNDLVEPRVLSKGWGIRRGPTGGREFCCPRCTAELHEKATAPLPPYSADACCPKCHHDDVATKYFTGREHDAPLGVPREHLGRTCRRCGYAFVQGCADQQ